MKITNTERRSVMNVAWSSRRAEPTRSFADCLRGAWKFVKRMLASAERLMAKAHQNGGRISFGSVIRSPTSNALRGSRYGRARDWNAGRAIARAGI